MVSNEKIKKNQISNLNKNGHTGREVVQKIIKEK